MGYYKSCILIGWATHCLIAMDHLVAKGVDF